MSNSPSSSKCKLKKKKKQQPRELSGIDLKKKIKGIELNLHGNMQIKRDIKSIVFLNGQA